MRFPYLQIYHAHAYALGKDPNSVIGDPMKTVYLFIDSPPPFRLNRLPLGLRSKGEKERSEAERERGL